jgi:hypothetical protein
MASWRGLKRTPDTALPGGKDYIPAECIRAAQEFLKRLQEDVRIYRQLEQLHMIARDEEADRFCAYLSLGRYADYPHALITLYEAQDDIDEAFGPHDTRNIFSFIRYRMKSYYRLLGDNGMTDG